MVKVEADYEKLKEIYELGVGLNQIDKSLTIEQFLDLILDNALSEMEIEAKAREYEATGGWRDGQNGA
jgi:hypothetical protein